MSLLAELRAAYPQYDDLSDADFARGLHAVYQERIGQQVPWEGFARSVGLLTAAEEAPAPRGMVLDRTSPVTMPLPEVRSARHIAPATTADPRLNMAANLNALAALRPPEEQPGLERPAPGVVEMPDLPPPLDPQQIRPRPQLPVRGTAEGRFVSQSNARNALAAITPGPGRAYSPAPPVSNLRRTLDTLLGSPTAAGTPQAETEALLEAAARRSVAPGEVAPTGAQYARQIGAREGVLERGARDVASGAVSTASGLLGFLASETGSRALRSGQVKVDELARDLLPADPGFLDQLASGFGSTATFFIPGLGIARGAQAAALLAPRMALWLGSGAAAGMEAAVEAGSVYGQLLDQGRSEREAAQAAERVFWKNAALVGLTNRLGLFAEKGGQLARRSLAAAMEYGQEAGQQGISNVETGRPVGEGTGTSGTIGAIVGAALGGGPVVRRPRPERLGEALADKIESTQFARPAEAVAAERLDPSRAQLQGRRRETVQHQAAGRGFSGRGYPRASSAAGRLRAARACPGDA